MASPTKPGIAVIRSSNNFIWRSIGKSKTARRREQTTWEPAFDFLYGFKISLATSNTSTFFESFRNVGQPTNQLCRRPPSQYAV